MSQHLSYPERCIIERLLNCGKNYAEIARQIERSKSTVMREVKKNVVVVGVKPQNNNSAKFICCQERYLCDYGKKTAPHFCGAVCVKSKRI
ncbi:MAG: helix-turn-helix domain-containing protein [Eubacterium sp.]|nr:helix-turn-helix domain-containing protein [Eubacterium sp.]